MHFKIDINIYSLGLVYNTFEMHEQPHFWACVLVIPRIIASVYGEYE